MKIVRNDKLIKRNATIGQYTSLLALAVLGVGMYLSIRRADLFMWSLIALVVGFFMTQIGMFYTNRWGRNPRADQQIDTALKGLPADTYVYHYATPVAHLVVGAPGIWIIETRHQRGKVTYERNRWKLSGGGFMQAYMSIFGQEGIGRPDIEIANDVSTLKKYLSNHMDLTAAPEVQTVLVFTNEESQVEAPDAPTPTLKLKQLKDFLRQRMKERPMGPAEREQVRAALGGEVAEEE